MPVNIIPVVLYEGIKCDVPVVLHNAVHCVLRRKASAGRRYTRVQCGNYMVNVIFPVSESSRIVLAPLYGSSLCCPQ